MPITISEIQGGPELVQKVNSLSAELQQARTFIEWLVQAPQPWLLKSEANKLFVGKGGKPVHRNTFNQMVQRWKERGYLVDGLHVMSDGNTEFLNINFLKGIQKAPVKLRRAS